MKFLKNNNKIINVKELKKVFHSTNLIIFQFYDDDEWELTHMNHKVISTLNHEFSVFLKEDNYGLFDVGDYLEGISYIMEKKLT